MSEEILHFLDRIIELESTVAELNAVLLTMFLILMITAIAVYFGWLHSSLKRTDLEGELNSTKRDIERLESRFNAKNGY